MIIFISILLSVFFLTALYNLISAPRFKKKNVKSESSAPWISVLIPARNEEKNISGILSDLAMQDYLNFEVIAGNDNSTDNTEELMEEFTGKYQHYSRVNVPPLPPGWHGKSHALHTIYAHSKGEYLLFVDADVRIRPETISSAVYYMQKYGADILSVFPEQKMKSIGEKLIVPLLNFFLLSLLPLRQVYQSGRKSLAAGIGQFIAFRKEAYEKCGGHLAVKNKIAEDLELIRIAKKKHLKVLTLLDAGLVSCRMYSSFPEAAEGFSKNFFRGSSLPAFLFIALISGFSFLFLSPFLLVFIDIGYLVPLTLILITRFFISIMSRQNTAGIILHPLQMIILFGTGLRSVLLKNKLQWKGRSV